MKKVFDIYEDYMIRPTIYKFVPRAFIGLVAAMLWNRYINVNSYFSMVGDTFLVIGFVFLLLTWITYLRVDGISVHHLLEKPKQDKKVKRHSTKDIVDFADEKIIPFAELEPEERLACLFMANAVSAIVFLVPAVIMTIIRMF